MEITKHIKPFLFRVRDEINFLFLKDWAFADVARHWDAVEDYDSINEATYSYYRRFTDGLKYSDVIDNGLVLDFCARTGNGTLYFYKHGKVREAVCADVSFSMGEICIDRLNRAGIKSFTWLPIENYCFPLADNSFDTILCFETIEHFPHPEILIGELSRLLKENGTLILSTPNVIWEPIHALAAILNFHHSEGPHRFIRLKRLKNMILNAGLSIYRTRTTVLIPSGLNFLINWGEKIENITRNTLMPIIGLRHIIVAHK
jgi:SAM-dependent methyltransferase